MSDLTPLDIVVLTLLMMSVPLLVDSYLKGGRFPSGAKAFIIAGGLVWLVFGFFADTFSWDVLGVPMLDAMGHKAAAATLAHSMEQGQWDRFWEHFRTGNSAYQCYVALIIWAGPSVYSAHMVNGWACFWGGLILANCFAGVCPYSTHRNFWLYATIFMPSVVFWGAQNIKEGLLFWSICCILSSAFPGRHTFFLRSLLVVAAILVGSVLRPHVILGWLVSVAAVNVFARGRRALAVLMILFLPMLAMGVQTLTGAGMSTESMSDMADSSYEGLAQNPGQGSKIEYLMGKPIFFVSGFVSAFFRPFPWKIGSARLTLSVVETWASTLTLAWIWFEYGSSFGVLALRMPAVRAAILGVMWMCILLTYFPNEGLIIRQKVQLIPGLLTLAVVPFLLKEAAMQRLVFQRTLFAGRYSSAYTGPESG